MRSDVSIKECLNELTLGVISKHHIVHDTVLSSITSDSRKVVSSGLFVAIKGTHFDGHLRIEDAIQKGVNLVIGESFSEAILLQAEKARCGLIRVESSRKAYALLSFLWFNHPQKNLKVVGITGTNGKTTVASLCWQLLNKTGIKADLLGTAGKSIGGEFSQSSLTTSDALDLAKDFYTSKQAGTSVLVMEVSSHALDQNRTAAISFDIAVFTNLSHDHLDYHGSMEAYAEAKYKLFSNLNSSAVAVINADDHYASMMAKTAARTKLFSFSSDKKDTIQASIEKMDRSGMHISCASYRFQTQLIGRFNAQNAVSAVLVAESLGITKENMEGAMPGVLPASGRMQFVSVNDSEFLPLVVVDYAHTPDAMENTLAAVHELLDAEIKLRVVFGCGGDRDREKRPKMGAIAESYADYVYVTDDNPRTESSSRIIEDIVKGFSSNKAHHIIPSREEAIREAITDAQPEEIILILGKGHETYQEIGTTRHHFDDREIAKSALLSKMSQKQSSGGVQ